MTRHKLARIRSRWRRLVLSLFISILLLISQHRTRRPRALVHWVGQNRPRRLERPLFLIYVMLPMFILEPLELVVWAMWFGGFVSIVYNLHAIYSLVLRRHFH